MGFWDLQIDPSIPPAAFLDLVSPRFFIAFAGIRAPLHSFSLEPVSQLANSNSLGLDFPLIPLFFLSPRGSLLDSRCRDSRPLDTTVDDALPKYPKHPRILKVGLLGNKSRLLAHQLLHKTAALCVPDRRFY